MLNHNGKLIFRIWSEIMLLHDLKVYGIIIMNVICTWYWKIKLRNTIYFYFHTWIVPEEPPRTRCRRSGGKILSRILFSCSFVALVGPWLLTTLAAAKETKKRFCDEAILQWKMFWLFTTHGMSGKSNGKLLEDHYSVIHQMLQIENYTIFVTNLMESP